MIIGSVILGISLFLSADLAQAQTKQQKQNECVSTVRARSMSISKDQAEKICEGTNSMVADCVVTKAQGAGSLKLEEMRDECDTQMSRRRDRVRIKEAREAEKKEAEAAAAAAKAKSDDVDADSGDKIVVPGTKDDEVPAQKESSESEGEFEEI